MKKLLSLILTIAIIICAVPFGAFTFSASAAKSGYYTYTVSNSKATITDVDTSISGDVIIPSRLGGYTVTGINSGGGAFFECNYVTSVTIPSSIKTIGLVEFSACNSLEAIYVDSGNEYFSSVDGVLFNKDKTVIVQYPAGKTNTTYVIPDTVNTIDYCVFLNCSYLTSVLIPDSVTKINNSAFNGCTNLTDVSIPDGVHSINYRAFYHCWSLTNITIPDSVTYIGESAFDNCSKLTSIIIPNEVTTIDEFAFFRCYNLENVTVGDSVKSIGSSAFYECSSLTDITIPDSVTSIGSYAFYGCNSLMEIKVEENNKYYSSADGVLFSKNKTVLIQYPAGKSDTAYTISNSVTSIYAGAFAFCKSLTNITIPISVTNINEKAFDYCTGIKNVYYEGSWPQYTSINIMGENYYLINATWHYANIDDIFKYSFDEYTLTATIVGCAPFVTTITIPETITKNEKTYTVTGIGDSAFSDCDSLTSITIPDSVTSIGESAFYSCNGLLEIIVEENNNKYCSQDGILFDKEKTGLLKYPAAKNNTLYMIPNSVTNIGYGAFDNCKNLATITISDNMTSISSYAFEGCTSLTSIIIPNSVTSIGDSAFEGCNNIENVYINDIASWCNIDFYHSYSNPLYYADNLYLNGELVDVVVIPDSVTSIGNYAFFNYSGLTSITIPDGVTSIGDSAFSGCSSLADVYYEGSWAERYDIEYGSYNTELKNAAWYYADPDVLKYEFDQDNLTASIVDCAPFATEVSIPETVTKDEVVYNIIKIGSYAFASNSITSVTIPYGVTSIGSNAFENCDNLTSVIIPDSVTSIGSNAFENCDALECVTIGQGVNYIHDEAFYGCRKLTTIYFNAINCTSMDSYYYYSAPGYATYKSVFEYCPITTVHIGNDVKNIPNYAFKECDNITDVYYGGSWADLANITIGTDNYRLTSATWHYANPDILKYSFNEENLTATVVDCKPSHEYVNISETVKKDDKIYTVIGIEKNAFRDYDTVKTIIIPDSITRIGDYAFYNCSSLTSITIPDSVTNIGGYAFCNCDSLTSVDIGNDITSIEDSTFEDCDGFTSITIPDNVASIGNYAFYGCDNLVNLTIGKGATSIGEYAFSSCSKLTILNYNATKCTKMGNRHYYNSPITTVNVGDNVTYFPSYAFYDCNNLSSVYITDLTAWCNIEFSGSYSNPVYYAGNLCLNGELVTDLVIPNNLTSINYVCFNGCSSIKSVVIPEGIRTIEGYAFSGCKNITSITIPKSITQIDSYAFGYIDDVKVYYQSGQIEKSKIAINSYAFDKSSATWYYNACIGTEIHTYDNTCDTNCNICGYTREIVHTYSNDCDAECNICYFVRVPRDHIYSAVCDASCNECGDLRQIPEHKYFNNCDTTCNECGDLRQVSDHIYDNNLDVFCNVCNKPNSMITYTIENDEVTIISLNTEFFGELVIPCEIEGYSVTTIANNAFKDCNKLTKLVLPDSITSIGNAILSGCTGLLELEIPFLNKKFAYLFGTVQYGEISNEIIPLSLKSVTINGGDIPSNAFNDCNSISVVALGDDVTSIGSYAFYSCNSITKVTVGDSVTNIGTSAFEDCISLTRVTIGGSVETIDNSAFKGCLSLQSVSVPDSVKKVNDSAFQNCKSLSTVTLGNKLEQIGNYAFNNCENLIEVVIPNSTQLIGSYAFQNCSKLKNVTFGSSVTTIFNNAFENCSELESVILPNSITSIGEYAFKNCTSLQRAVIKGRTNHINNGTFEGCKSLVTVAFTRNVSTIAAYAFYNCDSLQEVWYEGSEAELAEMTIAYGNDDIKNATWFYNMFDTVTHIYDSIYDADCNVCGEVREVTLLEWEISVTKTGVYTLKPNSKYTGVFSTDKIIVSDKSGNIIKFNESKGGFPLVADQDYTVKFNYDCSDHINGTVTWTTTRKAQTIFSDVSASEWYNNAIIYAVGRGIINGYGGTNNFGPGDNIQRQDFMVILAKLDGVDLTKYGNKKSAFSDVPEGSYFEAAVNWGAEKGIVNGYANGKFGTGDKITREQLVKFLYNYANYKGIDTSYKASTKTNTKRDFDDYNQISSWALDSVLWAKENNIIKGKEARKIVPAGNALRCEVAQIMYNIFLNDIF